MDNKQGVVASSVRPSDQISITAIFIVLAVFACLACECSVLSAGYCGYLAQQLRVLSVDNAAQLGAVFVVATFTAILVAGRMYTTRTVGRRDIWFLALFVIGLMSYFQHYDSAYHFAGGFVFFFGFLVGELVRQSTLACASPTKWRLGIAVAVLGSILFAALCQAGTEQTYKYYGALRWCGGWDNPNTCGLLMGVAFVLGWGLLKWCLTSAHLFHTNRFSYRGTVCLLLIIQIAALIGLITTYSRGAWLGTAIALIYWMARTQHRNTLAISKWAKVTLWVAPILAVSMAAGISAMAHNDLAVIRRVVSPTTAHDFSSRNRISAWIAGLQIMADHPLRGVGWNSPQICYDEYYKPADVQAATAIQTNDYVYIGAALGMPALVMLLSYIWIIIGKPRPRNVDDTVSNLVDRQLSNVLRTATLVLAVGFAFDGGLLSLPTGTAFWVLANAGDDSN